MPDPDAAPGPAPDAAPGPAPDAAPGTPPDEAPEEASAAAPAENPAESPAAVPDAMPSFASAAYSAAAATQAAAFVRALRARGLLSPASTRRVFLAFLVTVTRGATAVRDIASVRALVVAITTRISAVDAAAVLGGVSAAEVAKHAACVASALPSLAAASETALDAEYRALLDSGAAGVDLRSALNDEASVLVQSPLTPEQSPGKRAAPDAPDAPATPPKRRRVEGDAEPPATPRTPARSDVPRTPRTPAHTPRTPVRASADLGSFAKFVLDSPAPPVTPSRFHRSGVDALDALAAVASNTPRSPAVNSRSLPGTPVSMGVAIAAWLRRVSEARCEDVEGSARSAELKAMIADEDWARITDRLTRLLGCYTGVGKGIELQDRRRDVLCVYFATLEAILVREKKRGGVAGGATFVNKLVRSGNFHACLLSCALETVAAVHGLQDMATINAALSAFELSAYELTKAISSFARQLPECPRMIAKHLITCEQRYVESVVWKQDSDLVKYLSERATKSHTASLISGTAANKQESNTTATATTVLCVDQPGKRTIKSEDTVSEHKESSAMTVTVGKAEVKDQSKKEAEKQKEASKPRSNSSTPHQRTERSQTTSPNRLSVKDLTLQLFYKKLLYIAQERMLEMLSVLHLHYLAEPVFTIIKHAVWEKWYLLVDRHLDQIILCSIYGVAKVRGRQIRFKTIISHYQNASHLSESTFKPLLPGVYREISLKNHAPAAPHLPPRQGSDSTVHGDIIKMYNTLFMPTMKPFLLEMDPRRSENVSVGAHSTGTIRANSESATLPDSASMGRDKQDPVSISVLQSPLRPRRHHASPRKIGNVTVSPMSPRVHPLVSLRQSPRVVMRQSPAHTSMTPNTRTLYAFGESPVRPQSATGRHAPVPPSFNRSGERTASIRRMYAEAFSNKGRTADVARQHQAE